MSEPNATAGPARKDRRPKSAALRAEARRLASQGVPGVVIAEQLSVSRATLCRWAIKTAKRSQRAVEKAMRQAVQQHPGLSHLVSQAVRTVEHLSGAGERAAAALAACTFKPFAVKTPRELHEVSRAWELFLAGSRRQLGLDAPGDRGQAVTTQVAVMLNCRERAQPNCASDEVIELEPASPPNVE